MVASKDMAVGNRKILLICNEIIGRRLAGTAIRSVEMARALSTAFDVTVAAPTIDVGLEVPFRLLDPVKDQMQAIASASDLIIIQGDALVRYPFLKKVEGVLVADMYCPIPLEYHQMTDDVQQDLSLAIGAHLAHTVAEQVSYADYFLCASEKQRDFWFGALTVAGRINALRWPRALHASIDELIAVVPFGLPDDEPVTTRRALRARFGIPKDAFVAIWGGGVYQWFDPLTIIFAIGKLAERGIPVHLVFMGIKHPNTAIVQHDRCAQAIALADRLGLTGRLVHFNYDWIEYGERQDYLLDADVGVSAHFSNLETRFSFRTRMLDYLWCGLPIISTRGDVFADLIQSEHVGAVINYEDVDGWIEALGRMKRDQAFLVECRRRVRACAHRYRWSIVTKALIDLVHSAVPAKDRAYARKLFRQRRNRTHLIQRIRHAYTRGGIMLLSHAISRRLGWTLK